MQGVTRRGDPWGAERFRSARVAPTGRSWIAARRKQGRTLAAVATACLSLICTASRADEQAKLPAATAQRVDYVRDVRPILQKHCYACHAGENHKSGLRLDIKSEAFRGGDSYGPSIVAGDTSESPLIQFVADEEADLQMPPKGDRLSAGEVATLTRWVVAGADWPEGVDLAKLVDRRDHWSFHPVTRPPVPDTQPSTWPRGEIDRFILARLEQHDLHPAVAADRTTWLRRVYLDLIGLPPTPQQVDTFRADEREDAYELVVEELLNSPHYGERWAQHWLDVVRYADTHGFEVNTERTNAWPYRDYVIRAFNNDTPYDRFVREQLAGDTLGHDAATGFLVTAAVLLPGQIGKDDASKRLARQDSLAEIVINTGEALLGLSIGCARCHDHKFDPISQRDYYSMQAFFSGVRYEPRQVPALDADSERRKVEQLKQRLAEVGRQLAHYEPLARVDVALRTTDPRVNEERFEPLDARFIRFSIEDANLHPLLGLIEPCIDEFEIFSAEATPRNVALAQHGTRVTASGSRTSAAHRLEHVHDGRYGNSRSWMSDEAGRGWIEFELPEPVRIGRVVWSRDRNGQYDDRLATAFKLEAGLTRDSMKTVSHVATLRSAVSAQGNVDRFTPVTTERLRFTINEANNLAPCIDELEVFDVDGDNVALASAGTKATSSGDAPRSQQHKLEHINDGQYGNARSWISSENGRGWVELTFATPQEIERVAWARDRDGKYTDRLPLRYTIEVWDETETWRTVASSSDRRAFVAGDQRPANLSSTGLSADQIAEAKRLQGEQQQLLAELTTATQSRSIFAGRFTDPEPTYRLLRGDAEQPREQVAPTVIESLGELQLPTDAPEQHRRQALAAWIASPDNPLTARVMVNRIWQGHFGIGLVETANDFGRAGTLPSHPQLLDWLASEFVRNGWSIKKLHRIIVLSATYRQSSQVDLDAQSQDADARLLWRFPARRLEAEAIRDSILAVNGRLNPATGGPGFDLFRSRGGLDGFPPIESFTDAGLRRMIYAHKVRMEREVVFGAFDCPDAGQSAPRRRQSTTPIQALNLLNSRFTIDQSNAFAARVTSEFGDDAREQIRGVYRIAFGREPAADEINDAEPVVKEYGLAALCRVIFNSNEFLFLP